MIVQEHQFIRLLLEASKPRSCSRAVFALKAQILSVAVFISAIAKGLGMGMDQVKVVGGLCRDRYVLIDCTGSRRRSPLLTRRIDPL